MINGTIIPEEKNESKHILPVFFPPPIVSFLDFPFQLSIILTREETKAWFFSNYIQLFSHFGHDSDGFYLLHFHPDHYFSLHDQYFIDISLITDGILPIDRANIIDNICKWIDNNYYVSVILAEKELPGTILHKEDFLMSHPQFIFGYDKAKQIVKILNFDEKREFSMIEIKFQELEYALFSPATKEANVSYNQFYGLDLDRFVIRLYKFRPVDKFAYIFDPRVIINQLEDYLHSKDTSLSYKLMNPKAAHYENAKWGLSVYEGLISYLNSNLEPSGRDYRAFHCLWEHKRLMTARFEYLAELGYLESNDDLIKEYNIIENEVNTIRRAILMQVMQKTANYTEYITSELQSIAKKEQVILEKICEKLKSLTV